MLRLQNKYRNTLKKQPQRLVAIAREMGLQEEQAAFSKKELIKKECIENESRDFLRRRLENEINVLYDRLAQALKAENERLRKENENLKEENQRLKV